MGLDDLPPEESSLSAIHTTSSSTSSDTINRQAPVTPSMSFDWSQPTASYDESRHDVFSEQSRAELEDDEPYIEDEELEQDDEDEDPPGFGIAPRKNPAPFRAVRTFRYINKFTGGKK